MSKPLKIAVVGCGNRARVYLSLLSERPDQFEIVAAADPNSERIDFVRELSVAKNFLAFRSDEDILSQSKLADVILIATQDNNHLNPTLKAIEKGYDILLEKPISDSPSDILKISEKAKEAATRIIVCHVLRYTSFYRKLQEIVASGRLGQVITMNASEGIEAWHFAHSYVRGNWSVMENSTPTIVAKCSHDMDLLHWILGKKCLEVSSFGSLSFFKKENAKLEMEYPMFDSNRYLSSQKSFWLDQVLDDPKSGSDARREWLKNSPWGRSVFHGGNTAVDHQVLNLLFEDEVTATFTMSAFDEGRNFEIHGTRASLRAGDFYKTHAGADIIIRDHDSTDVSKINVVDQNPHPKFGDYHMGGDVGFAKDLHNEFTTASEPLTSLSSSVHSHIIAFAAEAARKSNAKIKIEEYVKSLERRMYALD